MRGVVVTAVAIGGTFVPFRRSRTVAMVAVRSAPGREGAKRGEEGRGECRRDVHDKNKYARICNRGASVGWLA